MIIDKLKVVISQKKNMDIVKKLLLNSVRLDNPKELKLIWRGKKRAPISGAGGKGRIAENIDIF